MILGVLKEPPPETRVSLLPEHISLLKKNNIEVIVEPGAGVLAFATDESYKNAGASIASREEIINKSDMALAIHLPSIEDVALFPKVMAGIYQPFYNADLIAKYLEAGVCLFSVDMIPRTSRAQAMDVLSSQASIAGYKAVLLAADLLPKYFPMLMTAAGSIPPAKVLILGAGVAGLQAIATARRLGAVVEVFDTRPAVKEEVMSLGAKFIEVEGAADASKAGGYAVQQSPEFLQRQQEKIAASIAKSDVVITTAQIFGKKAPVLVTEDMIADMKNGSVIIDLAASTGGNTSLTRNNETVNYNGVTIVGNSNLPSRMPYDASKLYGKNMVNFLKLLVDEQGIIHTDMDDDLVKSALIKQPSYGNINS